MRTKAGPQYLHRSGHLAEVLPELDRLDPDATEAATTTKTASGTSAMATATPDGQMAGLLEPALAPMRSVQSRASTRATNHRWVAGQIGRSHEPAEYRQGAAVRPTNNQNRASPGVIRRPHGSRVLAMAINYTTNRSPHWSTASGGFAGAITRDQQERRQCAETVAYYEPRSCLSPDRPEAFAPPTTGTGDPSMHPAQIWPRRPPECPVSDCAAGLGQPCVRVIGPMDARGIPQRAIHYRARKPLGSPPLTERPYGPEADPKETAG